MNDILAPLMEYVSRIADDPTQPTRLATISAVSSAGVLVIFDGETTASARRYMVLAAAGVSVGDRVLMLRAGSTWVCSGPVALIAAPYTAWTPTVTAETGAFTTVSGAGRFREIFRTVFWSLSITVTTIGTAANGLRFTLPVNARANGYIGTGRSAAGMTTQVVSISAAQAQAVRYDNTTVIGVGTAVLSGQYEAA